MSIVDNYILQHKIKPDLAFSEHLIGQKIACGAGQKSSILSICSQYCAERLVLHKLSVFHALTDLLTQSWGGLLEQHEFESFDNAASVLMKSLRPECVALVDAFDFTDTILNSALGSSDGKVYEKLYESARVSAMNVDESSGRRVEVPPCLRAVKKYLSKDFLMKGLRPSSSVHHPGSRL